MRRRAVGRAPEDVAVGRAPEDAAAGRAAQGGRRLSPEPLAHEGHGDAAALALLDLLEQVLQHLLLGRLVRGMAARVGLVAGVLVAAIRQQGEVDRGLIELS